MMSSCSLFGEGNSILTSYTPTPTPNPKGTPIKITASTPTPFQYLRTPAIEVPTNSLNALLEDYIPNTSGQVILVTVYNGTQKLYCVEAMESGWKVMFGPFECNIGRNGLGKEKEGDGKSPTGVYELGSAFGYGGAPEGSTWPWRETTQTDYWVEDSISQYYNLHVDIDEIIKDWEIAAKLYIPEYRRALEVLYNPDNIKGDGSAIFLHVWKNEETSTGGCTAMTDATIETVLKWLREDANALLLQIKYIDPLPDGFCYIKDYAPEVKFDIRFAGEDNILGRIANEYYAAVGISSIKLTKAIDKASQLLKDQNLRLLIYDSYRPQTTTNAIVDWLADDSDDDMKEYYYPNIDKEDMLDMFFESKSAYSRGSAVDLTIIDKNGLVLDMGTKYQFIDEKSNFNYTNLSDEQRNNRELLRDVMIQAGLTPNNTFWWSFYLENEPFSESYFDFYVQ